MKRVVTYDEMFKIGQSLVEKLKDHTGNRISNYTKVYPIARGGYLPAIIISQLLGIPLVCDKNHIDEHSTLIVDDICDSGSTLIPYTGYLTVVYFARPSSSDIPVIYGETTEDWVQFPDEKCNDTDTELLRVVEYLRANGLTDIPKSSEMLINELRSILKS